MLLAPERWGAAIRRRPQEGRSQEKYRQDPSVHGLVLCLLCLYEGRIAPFKRGSVRGRPLIGG